MDKTATSPLLSMSVESDQESTRTEKKTPKPTRSAQTTLFAGTLELPDEELDISHQDVQILVSSDFSKGFVQAKGNLSQSELSNRNRENEILVGGHAEFMKSFAKLIPPKSCEIRFKNINYSIQVPARDDKSSSSMPTVGTNLERLLFFWKPKKMVDVDILKHISGIIRPQSMVLVLGPPGSGKSSFLKLIAGRLKSGLNSKGELLCNGARYDAFMPEKVFGFVDQVDNHIATLTVRETLEFALKCNTYELHANEANAKKVNHLNALKLDLFLKLLGLDGCQNTFVGDNMLRGVSGGERKRVTLGEMLIIPFLAYAMDEISTGLDSAATYDIVLRLRDSMKVLGHTYLVSLLQPPPHVFELFDTIVLLSHGEIVFQGPRESVIRYFNEIGFSIPANKDQCDFLQEVTTPAGLSFVKQESKFTSSRNSSTPLLTQESLAPQTTHEFVGRFRRSVFFQKTREDLKTKPHFDTHFLKGHMANFVVPLKTHVRLLLDREFKQSARDKSFLVVRLTQCLIMGVINGVLFWNLPISSWRLRYGLFFNSAMFVAMGNLAQLPVMFKVRPVFYKQRQARFFPTKAYVAAFTLSRLAVSLLEAVVFGSLVYFMCGLALDITRYLTFISLLFCLNIAVGSFFRFVGSLAPDLATASPLAGFCVVFFVVYAGYLITKNNIPAFFMPIHWISPIGLAFTALVRNEFMSEDYGAWAPSPNTDMTLGALYLATYNITAYEDPVAVLLELLLFAFVCVLGMGSVYQWLRHRELQNKIKSQNTEGGGLAVSMNESIVSTSFNTSVRAEDYLLLSGNNDEKRKSNREVPPAFVPITLTFDRLNYAVSVPGQDGSKPLLHNVSGFFEPGVMTALMGSTGAGKTTLLDVLAQRKTGWEGQLCVNGRPLTESFMRVAGYCEQQDIHSPLATVREALEFSANLRLRTDVSPEEKKSLVNSTLALLELESLKNAVVGDPLSGGIRNDIILSIT
jgi:ABC-type multidrug transport system ATPase subunit